MATASDLARLLVAEHGHEDEPIAVLDPAIEAEVLRGALADLYKTHDLAEGMIVRQKRGCALYADPSANGLAIVVELLDDPVAIDAPCGSPYWRTAADMRIGKINAEGHFLIYHVDSARYEPVPEEELALVQETRDA